MKVFLIAMGYIAILGLAAVGMYESAKHPELMIQASAFPVL